MNGISQGKNKAQEEAQGSRRIALEQAADEAGEIRMNEDCFGEYPDNECDRETCHNMCEDVMRCIMNTPHKSESESK